MPTETELLAQKLRDVVEALIGADAALESRIARLEDLFFEPSKPENNLDLEMHLSRARAQREGFADVREMIAEYDANESRNWLGRVFRIPSHAR